MLRASSARAIVDADAIAHELTGPAGAAIAAIRARVRRRVDRCRRRARPRRACAQLRLRRPAARAQRSKRILHPRSAPARCRAGRSAAPAAYASLVDPAAGRVRATGARVRARAGGRLPRGTADRARRSAAHRARARRRSRRSCAAQASAPQRLAAADDVICNGAALDEARTRTSSGCTVQYLDWPRPTRMTSFALAVISPQAIPRNRVHGDRRP